MTAESGSVEEASPTTETTFGRSVAPFASPTPSPHRDGGLEAGGDGERNLVFTNLVREDGDITGLVAYSIYKQNKLDWLQAFERVKGRPPEAAEQAAYIIGESTPRRLATYRHLADATLMGQGPEPGATASSRVVRRGGPSAASWMGPSLIVYGILAVVILVAFYLAFHFTGRP